MDYIYATIIVALMLTGCTPEQISGRDQCMRNEIFMACLEAVPDGPESTKYNDWAEVVGECEAAAYYQSLRRKSQISEECLL